MFTDIELKLVSASSYSNLNYRFSTADFQWKSRS